MTDHKVSTDLAAILDMAQRLEQRAIDQATRGDRLGSTPIGGDAMVNLAGVGSLEAVGYRRDTIEQTAIAAAYRNGTDPSEAIPDDTEDAEDYWQPVDYLRFWAEDWRRELDWDCNDRATIETEATFLAHRDVLAWAWENEPHFDEFAADVAKARAKLEVILLEGDRAERSRIVCPDCPAGRGLIRVYEARTTTEWACVECTAHVSGDEGHCPNPLCWSVVAPVPAEWESDPDADVWKCPACRHKFAQAELADAYAKQMRQQDAARYVTVNDAVSMLRPFGWQERTVRKWIAPLYVAQEKCTECGGKWPVQEYPACPRKVLDRGQIGDCGGLLVPVWRGDRESVPESHCDITTRQRYVYWPDLWRRHLSAQQARMARKQTMEVAV